MGKTIILNLSDIDIRGDILDIGESYGVIYNISKEIDDEVSVDYIEEEESQKLNDRKYDNCTMFFALSGIWRDGLKEKLVNKISNSVKESGQIYIWDINKEFGKIFSSKIKAVLPSGNIKEFEFRSLNPMISSNIEETKKILSKEFYIEEEKLWEDIYFIRGRKKK